MKVQLQIGASWIRVASLVVPLIWGGNLVATRLTLLDLGPLHSATIKTAAAAAVLLAWVRIGRLSLALERGEVYSIGLLSLLSAGSFAAIYFAVGRTSTAQATLLIYLYPLLAALLARLVFPEERVTPRTALALVLGFAGASLALLAPSAPGSSPALASLLALTGATLWAAQTVLAKHLGRRLEPLLLAFFNTALCSLWLAAFAFFLESSAPRIPSLQTILALVYQVVLVETVSGVLWVSLLRCSRVTSLVTYSFVAPVAGVLACALLLGETLYPVLLLSTALVAVALRLVERPLPDASPSRLAAAPGSFVAALRPATPDRGQRDGP